VQIQALDRTQPLLPMRPGQVERHTDDYKRHGTTSLFAALDVKAGTVIGKCMPRHRAQEFRRFLDTVEGAVPVDLGIHVVMDNAFFALLTEQQIRRGAHRSTKALEAAIAAYIDTATPIPSRSAGPRPQVTYSPLSPASAVARSTPKPNVHRNFRIGTLAGAHCLDGVSGSTLTMLPGGTT
jgi:DDE superfamily endonuclease